MDVLDGQRWDVAAAGADAGDQETAERSFGRHSPKQVQEAEPLLLRLASHGEFFRFACLMSCLLYESLHGCKLASPCQ